MRQPRGGVISLNRYLALALAPARIRVNAIAPGKIDSGEWFRREWEVVGEEKRKEMMKATPLGRHGTPEEVANVVLFLASDESAYITGATVDVNGGNYMF